MTNLGNTFLNVHDQVLVLGLKCAPLLGASLLGFVSTLLCARFMVWEVFLLKNIAKDWLGFLPLLRRVSQDTSCVLVRGIL
jgi:hypothetical protein